MHIKKMKFLCRLIIFMTLLHEGITVWGSWSKWSECSATCGEGVKKSRERTCPPANCKGEMLQENFCFLPNCPSDEECGCGCKLMEREKVIDYLKTFTDAGVCIWQIETVPNSRVQLNIQDIQLLQGTIVISDEDTQYRVINRVHNTLTEQNIPFEITSKTNKLNISIQVPLGTNQLRVRGNYKTIGDFPETSTVDKKTNKGLNISAIIGIACCAIIIIIASTVAAYCKYNRNKNEEKSEDEVEEGMEDNYSSASSTNRSSKNKMTSPRKTRMPSEDRELTPQRNNEVEQQRLINEQRNYSEGAELFIPATNVLVATQGGYITSQPYMNWSVQHAYSESGFRQAKTADYLMTQTQVAYAPQIIYDPSQTYHYPASGPE